MKYHGTWTAAAALLALAACSPKPAPETKAEAPALPAVVSAEGDFATNLQTALIEAKPGDTVRLPEGVFNLTTGLSLDVDGVTLVGASLVARKASNG